jgi:hypothetical protein
MILHSSTNNIKKETIMTAEKQAFDQVKSLKNTQFALLDSAGRRPKHGTKKRVIWESLDKQIDEAILKWSAIDRQVVSKY